ncbi:hypothetical protein GCM10010423_29160 [Streptomyces levis]|uniref:Tryptophan synthase beta chain-like PALP domain-containing protein n=1 Tax=Streptomyces levis TaxID=285566 RepID=A0ABP6B496_9ACTN
MLRLRLAIGSSGNAGIALGAYAAAAGLRCTVAGYPRLPETTREQLSALGADLHLFDTDRERVGLIRDLAAKPDTLAVSNIAESFVGCHPVGIEGYKRIAWEIADQAPAEVRHVVLPTCRGDLAWGVYRGFHDLHELRGHAHAPATPRGTHSPPCRSTGGSARHRPLPR